MRRQGLTQTLFAILLGGAPVLGQVSAPTNTLPMSPRPSQTAKYTPISPDSASTSPDTGVIGPPPSKAVFPSTTSISTKPALNIRVRPLESSESVSSPSDSSSLIVQERTDFTPEFPDAPSVGSLGSSSVDQDARDQIAAQFIPTALSIEPNTVQRWHTLDANFIFFQALSTAALIADSETTLRGLKQNPNATELNPLFGKHPTPARLYGIAVPLQVFNVAFSYHLKKVAPRRSEWKFIPKLSIAVHSIAAVNNLVVTR